MPGTNNLSEVAFLSSKALREKGAKTESGFTLLELLVAIALLGILGTILIPNFYRARPRYEREQFIGRINALVRRAWQNAIITHRVHRVSLDLDMDKRLIAAAMATGRRDQKGEPEFKPVSSSFSVPDTLQIKQFIIEGFDEMKRFSGRQTGEAWFFIVPEGLTQEVIINFIDKKDVLYDGRPRPVGLVLNPFTAQFEEYDSFQK